MRQKKNGTSIVPMDEFQLKYIEKLMFRLGDWANYNPTRSYGLISPTGQWNNLSKVDADIYIIDVMSMIEQNPNHVRAHLSDNELLILDIVDMCFRSGFIWGTDGVSMAMNIAKINAEIRRYVAPVEMLRMTKRLRNAYYHFKFLFETGERIYKHYKLIDGYGYDQKGRVVTLEMKTASSY